MIEAVLFDLDGTLLENDMDRFMRAYLRALSARLAHIMPPAQFVSQLMAATDRMIANLDPHVTNQEAFWSAFQELTGHSHEELRPIIDEFYVKEFGDLKTCAQSKPLARTVVQSVMQTGRPAVIATNPLFPLVAIRHRLQWAGVADLPFALITSYENMHFSKPHKEYYQEIAEHLRLPAGRCLMVGDDKVMDWPATQAGMQFFWVTEEQPFTREQGNLDHFHQLVRNGFLDG